MSEPVIINYEDLGINDPFASDDKGGRDLPFEQSRSAEPYEPRYDEIREIRPSMEQRLSGLSVNETKKRASSKPRRESTGMRDKYVYWRLDKEGDDWGAAYRRKIVAPQKEIERLSRKGNSAVLEETTRMGSLRASHLERLIDDANADEKGDARWEPVYIKSTKLRSKTTSKIECKTMDVILARTLPSLKPRGRKGSGELVDVVNSKPKDKGDKKDKKEGKDGKDKDKDSKSKEKDKDKDDLNLDDPFDDAPLFHKTGKPMDSQGPLEFKNGGLPEHIPPDRPIGAGARDEIEKKDKKDKKKKGNKSRRGSTADSIIDVGDLDNILPITDLDALLDGGHVLDDDGPIAEPGRRSRSRRRSKSMRRRGKSGARAESISFPPGYRPAYSHRDGGRDDDTSSSGDSGESKYGIGLAEHSSRTSNDTYDSIGRRGSHYEDIGRGERRKVYKEHYRGPRRNPAYAGGGGGDGYGGRPAHPRRYSSRGYYAASEPVHEQRQIGYRDYGGRDRGQLVRARLPVDDYDRPPAAHYYRRSSGRGGDRERPVLHYPDEFAGRRAERYMEESVIDDDLYRRENDRREDEIRRREERQTAIEQEEEWRRQELAMQEEERLREYGGRRRYYDDDGGGYGGRRERERDRSRGYSDGRYDARYDRDYRKRDYE